MYYKLKKISGDASFREFYRVEKKRKSSIIIIAQKEKFKNLTVYSLVNKILNQNKILAPKLINNYKNKSIIEISDLGKTSFYEFIKNKKNKLNSYKKLIDVLIKIQKIKLKKIYTFNNVKIKFKKYTINNLHKESDLFFDWYISFLFNKKKANQFKTVIKSELDKIYKKIHIKNICFTHRDFHASNVMIAKKNFGIIDSQDAVIGNPLYDVASLIDDVRIKIPKSTQKKLFEYYLDKSKFNKIEKKYLKNDFDILSVQRNLKILGIFVRLHLRDKKSDYLKFLPYTWKLINMRLKNPVFKNLKNLINKSVPMKMRNKVNF